MLETCCICLEKTHFLQNVNECVFGTVTYIEKLKTCTPNELWDAAFNICNDCIEKLDSAYSFIQLCLKNELYRKEQLRLKEEIQDKKPLNELESDFIKFVCYLCNKSFRLKRTLGLHITRIHTKPKKNVKRGSKINEECSDIKTDIKRENTQQSAGIDVEEQTGIGNEKLAFEDIKDLCDFEDYCNENDRNFSSDEEIVKKKKSYSGKKRGPKFKGPIACEFCELVFMRADKHIQHVRSKHTFEKPFKCNLCDAKYFSHHNLKIHKRKHTNEKPYICSSCGKGFASSNDLWQHNKTHDQVRQYGCPDCDRCFKTHSNLRTHKLQMHQDPGNWKFVCTVCGKKFPLNNNLIKHMRRHEGIKAFACRLCHKRFVEKIDLQTHLLSHSNERNHKCHLCLKEYKKRETLRRHLKTEHDIGNFVVKKPEKKHSCPMCPKIFAFNNKLQRHILTHTGEKPVKCELCDKRFRDNYDRNLHLRKDHDVEPKGLFLSPPLT